MAVVVVERKMTSNLLQRRRRLYGECLWAIHQNEEMGIHIYKILRRKPVHVRVLANGFVVVIIIPAAKKERKKRNKKGDSALPDCWDIFQIYAL